MNSRCKLAQRAILKAAVGTLKDLDLYDVNFVIHIVLSMNLDNKKLADFVLRVYQLSNTGRFSLTYNLDLVNHIKIRDSNRIKDLIKVCGDEKAWPELHKNYYLLSDEITIIQKMSNREYYAILNTLENAVIADDFENLLPCMKEKVDTLFLRAPSVSLFSNASPPGMNKNRIIHSSLYSNCYNHVCISETVQQGKIISFSGNNEIPQVAYVADTSDQNSPKKYCFEVMKLVEQLAKGDYINPETNLMFSELTIQQLLQKYEKEIKMYKCHLELLNKAENDFV